MSFRVLLCLGHGWMLCIKSPHSFVLKLLFFLGFVSGHSEILSAILLWPAKERELLESSQPKRYIFTTLARLVTQRCDCLRVPAFRLVDDRFYWYRTQKVWQLVEASGPLLLCDTHLFNS